MPRVNKETFLKYSSLFLVLAIVIYLPFFLEGKSFIHQGDGYHQHYPFFRQYLNMIRDFFATGDWQQWDWSIGLGQDTLLTYGYYVVGDPFVYLGLLFPKGSEELAFHIVMFVRIWAVGMSFLFYARKMRFGDTSALIASILYAFSHYTIYNVVRHPFFIHPLIFLPLIALGIEKVFRHESGAFFALMIGLAAISNFYFFYMLTILAFLYAILRYPDYGKGWKVFGQWFLKFLVGYLVGLLISAVVFLPQVYGFLAASRSPNVPPISMLAYPINYYVLLVLNAITPGTKFWTVGGLSIVSVLALPFLARQRKQKPGLFWGLILLFVLLLFPFFGSMMNGLSGPYNRFSFVFPFLLAITLVYFLDHLDEMKKRDVTWMKWLMIGFTLIYGFTTVVTFDYFLYLTPLVIGWGVYYIFQSYNKQLLDKKRVKQGVLVLAALNITTNALIFYTPIGKNAMAGTEDYGTIDASYQNVFGGVEENLPKDEWYRVGVTSKDNQVRNHYAYLDLMGLNSYASITNGAVSDFAQAIETSQYQIIQPLRNGIDDRRVANQAMGVRYILTDQENIPYLPASYEIVDDLSDVEQGIVVAETRNAAPFAYVQNQFVLEEDLANMHPVQRESLLENTVITENVFPNMEALTIRPTILPYQGYWEVQGGIEVDTFGPLTEKLSLTVTEKESEVVLFFDEPEKFTNQEVFLYIEGIDFTPPVSFPGAQENGSYRVNAQFNGQTKSVYQSNPYSFSSYFKRDNILIHLNEVLAAELAMGIQFETEGHYTFDQISVVSRPHFSAQSASFADRLQRRALNLEVFEDEYVKGTIDADAGMLVTSVPYTTGWNVLVDGEAVEIEKVNVGFIGVPLESGEHTVEFVYETPFLKTGLVLTVVGLAGVYVIHQKTKEDF